MLTRRAVQNVRAFHSVSRRTDLFSFFRKNKVAEDTPKPVPAKKTGQVMQELEQEATQNETAKPVKLRVLGEPEDPEISWNKEKNGFEVNAWPLSYHNANIDATQVNQAINQAYKAVFNAENTADTSDISSASLSDLNQRFLFVKHVSQQLQISIPDKIMTSITKVADLQQYFEAKVVGVKYDEKNPDAIYLDSADFEGLNVTVVDKKAEIKKQKQRFAEAFKQAKLAEKQRQQELLEKAMT